MTDTSTEVREASATLVAAFGAHDVGRYFGAFAPDATFLLYATPRLLASRAEYEAEWRAWEAEGFRVRTRVRTSDGEQDLAERETIVFRRGPDGRWLGVHEHLSAEP